MGDALNHLDPVLGSACVAACNVIGSVKQAELTVSHRLLLLQGKYVSVAVMQIIATSPASGNECYPNELKGQVCLLQFVTTLVQLTKQKYRFTQLTFLQFSTFLLTDTQVNDIRREHGVLKHSENHYFKLLSQTGNTY